MHTQIHGTVDGASRSAYQSLHVVAIWEHRCREVTVGSADLEPDGQFSLDVQLPRASASTRTPGLFRLDLVSREGVLSRSQSWDAKDVPSFVGLHLNDSESPPRRLASRDPEASRTGFSEGSSAKTAQVELLAAPRPRGALADRLQSQNEHTLKVLDVLSIPIARGVLPENVRNSINSTTEISQTDTRAERQIDRPRRPGDVVLEDPDKLAESRGNVLAVVNATELNGILFLCDPVRFLLDNGFWLSPRVQSVLADFAIPRGASMYSTIKVGGATFGVTAATWSIKNG